MSAPKSRCARAWLAGLVPLSAMLVAVGCSASPRSIAVDATTVAHDVVDKATPIVEKACVVELPKLKDPEWSERTALCNVVVPAHDALGLAVIAAKKAIQASTGEGSLLRLAAELATQVAEFTAAMVDLSKSGGAK